MRLLEPISACIGRFLHLHIPRRAPTKTLPDYVFEKIPYVLLSLPSDIIFSVHL